MLDYKVTFSKTLIREFKYNRWLLNMFTVVWKQQKLENLCASHVYLSIPLCSTFFFDLSHPICLLQCHQDPSLNIYAVFSLILSVFTDCFEVYSEVTFNILFAFQVHAENWFTASTSIFDLHVIEGNNNSSGKIILSFAGYKGYF